MERIGLLVVVIALCAAGAWLALGGDDEDVLAHAASGAGAPRASTGGASRTATEAPRTGAARPGSGARTAREVTGRVVHAETGRAARDVIVSIRELPSRRVVDVRTAIDGSFVHRGVAADTERVEVWATAPGAATATSTVPMPATAAALDVGTLRLARAVAVRGVVRTRDGVPIGGASVYLMPHDVVLSLGRLDMFGVFDRLFAAELIVASRTTDSGGRFEFRRAAPCAYAVGAFADGYSGQYSDLVVADGGPTLPLDIRLDPGHELTGVVVDAGGDPVAGAELALLSEAGRRALMLKTVKARSGEDGRFRFPAVERRPKLLFVRARGFASNAVKGVVPGENLRIEMSAGVRISGRVFDVETGAGVARARVGIMGYSRPVFAATESDETGRFVIAHAPASGRRFAIVDHGRYDLEMTAEQRESSFMGGLLLDEAASGEFRLDLAVRRGGTVRGRVVDAATGDPLRGVRVAFVDHGRAERQVATPTPRSAVSDDRGAFALHGVPPGPLRLSVHAGWSTPLPDAAGRPFTTVAADWDGREELPVFELRVHGPLTLSGVVNDEAGPVAGARVRLYSTDWKREADRGGRPRRNPALARATTTDAHGAFEIGPAPRRGAVTVVATHPEHPEPAELELETGDVPIVGLELKLARGAAISGKLVDASKRTVGGVAVTFRSEGGGACGAVTRADGRFDIPGLPGGRGRLVLVDDFWWIDERYSELTLPRGGEKEVVFEVRPAGVLEARFTGAARARAPVAEVRPAGAPGEPVARTPVLAGGRCRIPGLLPGRYDVTVIDAGHPGKPIAMTVTAEITARETTPVELPAIPVK